MKQETAHVSPQRWAFHVLVSAALGVTALMLVLATFIVMENNQDIRPVFRSSL